MKNRVSIVILIIVVAFVSFFGGTYFVNMTSDDKFCNLCHSWMDPMTKAYHQSPHGSNSYVGIKAKCANCHLPHDKSRIHYIFKKAYNGISEGVYMLTHDASKYDWIKNRKNAKNYVFDSGCLECHSNIVNAPAKNEEIKQMHKKWAKYKDAKGDDKLYCVSCHKNVGHTTLGKVLYDIKNRPVGKWSKEDGKY